MDSKTGKIVAGGLLLAGAAYFLMNKPTGAAPPPPPAGKANLYGLVKDSATNQPLDGVLIEVGTYQSSTVSDGTYLVENIEPGNYDITFSKSGYTTIGR